MPTFLEAVHSNFIQQVRLFESGNCKRSFSPTRAIPGSPEKVEVLTQRYEQGRKKGHFYHASLCQPDDAPLPFAEGWNPTVVANGRVPMQNKALVPEDAAHKRDLAHLRAISVLDEVRKMVGKEGPQ